MWSTTKAYVGSVGGQRGSYQANKAQRLSEEFSWPKSPAGQTGMLSIFSGKAKCNLSVSVVDAGQSTNSGRATGTDMYEEFEAVTKRKVPLSREHCLLKIDELWTKLKGANEEIVLLKAEVKQKDEELSVKETKLRGYAMRNVDLERKLQQQQQGNFKAFLIFM